MDFNKLYIFQVVSELESVSKAAKKLFRTQSAVSQQIALLEAELGFRLFFRKRGRIFLSPEGKSLAAVLNADFDHIRSAVHLIKDNLEMVEGQIRLGVLLDDSTTFSLSELLVHFSNKYPQVKFKISFGTNAEIEKQLVDGRIDLGILIVFKMQDMFVRHEIIKTTHTLMASAAMLRKMKSGGIEELLTEGNLIDFSDDFLCLTPWIAKNFPDMLPILKSRTPTIVVPNHVEALKMVERDWGVAILPEHLCKGHVKAGQLQKVFPKKKELSVGLDIAYFANRTLALRETLFIDFVRNSVKR